jgi:GH24 family phage-related lysozyme (muramidase)
MTVLKNNVARLTLLNAIRHAWVDRNIKVPLTEPQKVGIASFCPYNMVPGNAIHRHSTIASTLVTVKGMRSNPLVD